MNCEKCGAALGGASFCEFCGAPVPENIRNSAVPAAEQPAAAVRAVETVGKPENVITGAVGALIGAAIGGASIILLNRLGYVASISGLILAVCALKGYELLGNRLSAKGIVISVLLMLATPYLADRLDWALLAMEAYEEYGITFAEAFRLVPELIKEGAIEQGEYIKNLLMIYGFAALGAVSTVARFAKKK